MKICFMTLNISKICKRKFVQFYITFIKYRKYSGHLENFSKFKKMFANFEKVLMMFLNFFSNFFTRLFKKFNVHYTNVKHVFI